MYDFSCSLVADMVELWFHSSFSYERNFGAVHIGLTGLKERRLCTLSMSVSIWVVHQLGALCNLNEKKRFISPNFYILSWRAVIMFNIIKNVFSHLKRLNKKMTIVSAYLVTNKVTVDNNRVDNLILNHP